MITFFSMSVTYLIWRNLGNYCLIIGLNSSMLVKFQRSLSSHSHVIKVLCALFPGLSILLEATLSIPHEFECTTLIEPISQTWSLM